MTANIPARLHKSGHSGASTGVAVSLLVLLIVTVLSVAPCPMSSVGSKKTTQRPATLSVDSHNFDMTPAVTRTNLEHWAIVTRLTRCVTVGLAALPAAFA